MKILKGYHLKYLHSSYIMKLVASLPNNLTTRTFLDALLLDAIDCRRPFHADTIYFARMNDGERMIYSVDKTKLMTLLTQFKIFDKATNLLEDSKDGSESINFVMHIVFYYVKNRELKMFDYALGKLSREKMEILESEKKIAVVNAMEGSAVNDADEFIKEIEYKNEKQDDSTVEFVEGSDFLFHSIVYLAMKTGGSDYAVEAVEIMIKHKIQLSNQALNRLLHSLIKTDNTGLSINLYKKIEAANYKPNIIAQTTFIKSLLDRNLVNEAIEFVENKEMNIEGSNLVLHYYTQEQNFVKAIETFNRFTARDEYVAEKSTMTLLMTSATTMRQVKEVRTMAFTLFESERGENQVDMNEDHRWIDTLIHALGRCEAPEEAELLAKYYVKQGYRPSVWTFSSLIGSWGKCEEYERACKWYDWMIRDFDYIEKNILIYNALLHAAARSKLSQSDKLVEIEKWEAILNKETKKDITTFNILISFYISEGYLMKLELLFKEMENTNVPVGMQTCLRVCQSYSRKNDLKNALIWYKKLKGLSSRDMFLAWKSIMKLYEVTKDLKGMLVFMNTIKSHPQFTLNSLMVSQLSKLFVNLDMDECLTRMIQNDYAHLPDPLPEILSNELSRSSNLFQGSYSILLNYYCEKKEYEKGMKFIQIMNHSDIDDYIPSIVMKLCSYGRYFEECDALWQWTNAQEFNKDTQISYLLSSEYQFLGPDNSTTSLYLDTLGFQRNLTKLEDTFKLLTCACVSHGEMSGRIRTNGSGIWLDENVYNSFIEALCRCDAYERAVEVFLVMVGDGIDLRTKATIKTARTLLTPLKRAGKPELVEKVMEFCKVHNLNV